MIWTEDKRGKSEGAYPMHNGDNPIASIQQSLVFELGIIVSKVDDTVEPKPAYGHENGEDDFVLKVVFEVRKAWRNPES